MPFFSAYVSSTIFLQHRHRIFDAERQIDKTYSTKFPLAVIEKLLQTRNKLQDHFATKTGVFANLNFNFATVAALRRRGVTDYKDCQAVSDSILDNVVAELIKKNVAPSPVSWVKFERIIFEVRPLSSLLQIEYDVPVIADEGIWTNLRLRALLLVLTSQPLWNLQSWRFCAGKSNPSVH